MTAPRLISVPEDRLRELLQSRIVLGAVARTPSAPLWDLLKARARLTDAVDGLLGCVAVPVRNGNGLRAELLAVLAEPQYAGGLTVPAAAFLVNRRVDTTRTALQALAVAGAVKMHRERGKLLFQVAKP